MSAMQDFATARKIALLQLIPVAAVPNRHYKNDAIIFKEPVKKKNAIIIGY